MIDQNLNVRNQDMIERDTEPRNHCYVNRARTIFLYKECTAYKLSFFFDKMTQGKQDKPIQCAYK